MCPWYFVNTTHGINRQRSHNPSWHPPEHHVILDPIARASVSKNYAVRLRCPYGDNESWVILDNRSESLEQILLAPWDFECELHGAQREFPIEATEKDSTVGDEPRPKPPAPPAQARRRRASERQPLHVPVLVRGWRDAPGGFHADASTIIVTSGDAPVSLAALRADPSTIIVDSPRARVSLAAKVQAG